MAKFRRGTDASREPKASGSSFTRDIYWKADEKKYIQLLPSSAEERDFDEDPLTLDDSMAVLTHEMMKTVETWDDGNHRMATFVSRRDPAIDGPGGYDDLWERFKYTPIERTYMVAVELEPEFGAASRGRKKLVAVAPKTRTFENRDGEEVTVPVVGVIKQSWGNFWASLEALQEDKDLDLSKVVFAVQKTGSGKDTSYTWIEQNVEPVEIDSEHLVDLEAHIEGLASEQRMRDLIGPLPDDFPVNDFKERDKKAKANSNKGKGRKRAEADDSPPWQEDDAPEEDAFAKLKEEVNAK